jgi:hypothetical protein
MRMQWSSYRSCTLSVIGSRIDRKFKKIGNNSRKTLFLYQARGKDDVERGGDENGWNDKELGWGGSDAGSIMLFYKI